MIHVLATITAKPGLRDRYLGILKEVMPEVRAEKGCIAYLPMVDLDSGIPVQIEMRPDVVTLVEAWESLEHLRAHLKAPHMLAYREKTKDCVETLSIQVLAPA